MSELTVLQAVRLKGRVITTDLAQTLGEDLADVAATVDRLTAAGLLVDATPLRISPSGRMRLDDLLAEERNRADSTVLAAAYRDFRSVNADFKSRSPTGSSRAKSLTHTTTPNTTPRCCPASMAYTGGWARSSVRWPCSCRG